MHLARHVLPAMLVLAAVLAGRSNAQQFPDSVKQEPNAVPRETPAAIVRYGMLDDAPLRYLEDKWNADLPQQMILEQGYCASWRVEYTIEGDTIFMVNAVATAAIDGVHSPQQIAMRCPAATIPIHTHPPQTCLKDNGAFRADWCSKGGNMAHECFPSVQDLAFMIRFKHEVGAVQCGPREYVFYQPIQYLLRRRAKKTALAVPPAHAPAREALANHAVEPDTIPRLPTVTVTAPAAIWPDSLFPDTASIRTLRHMLDSLGRREDSLLVRVRQFRLDAGLEYDPRTIRPNVGQPSTTRKLLVFGGSAGLGYIFGLIDRDHGGYKDSWLPLSDKQAHFAGHVICTRELSDRYGAAWGLASCIAMGAALEQGQSRNGGYASWGFDFPYDIAGALVGAAWHRWHGGK